MNTKLIIVESPNKIKSITNLIQRLQEKKSLSINVTYQVESTVGHILELNKRWMPKTSLDVAKHRKSVIKGKKSIIDKLKLLADKADEILIATDPDREGEAIADDLVTVLKIENKYKRMIFNEITEDSIYRAFQNLTKIQDDMVNSQKTRMILDRMFGYKLSYWVQNKLWNTKARSAGRVQSPTLKLVVERELQINGFIPEKYIKIEQVINKNLIAPIVLENNMVDNKNYLLEPSQLSFYKAKLSGHLEVIETNITQSKGNLKIPYKQSSVYKSASTLFGFSAIASRIAMQSLFEKGFISYPRTDSTRYSETFIKKTHNYIAKKFGDEYIHFQKRNISSTAQNAHEALRITDPNNTPDLVAKKLKFSTEIKLYKMIYNHTLQTLMTPPKREIITYIFSDQGVKFKLSSSKVIFDGYLKLVEREKFEELPKFKKGDFLKSDKINFIEGETKPKSRYNEGTLIEDMEKVGVGRPSTFSSTVSTLITRGYIQKDKNTLIATRRGKALVIVLMLYFGNIIQEKYTSELEKILDQVAEGQKNYEEVLTIFWNKLMEDLNHAIIKKKKNISDQTQLISLANVQKESIKPKGVVSMERAGNYAIEYNSLLITFMDYVFMDKKNIEINYNDFIKNEFNTFLGPIIMPLPPKRGPYILENEELQIFANDKKYFDVEMCSICKKYPIVYMGGISKKNNVYWSKTCGGWRFSRCKLRLFLNSEDSSFARLESLYKQKFAEYNEQREIQIQEKTQEINLKKLTQQILLKDI